jgi:group I intron endonuclease
MTISGIYMIRHKESGKKYIGRSTDIVNRWNLHKKHTEQKKDRSPLHRAMRKYGYDAFEWKVLTTAPARLHVLLERQFICDWNVMVPHGYNVGGAAGGQPPRELLDAMGSDEREAKIAEMRENSRKMHTTLRERRIDPVYEAAYLANMKATALAREVARRERLANDPEYAAREKARRHRGGVKAQEAIRARAAVDPDFADKMETLHKTRAANISPASRAQAGRTNSARIKAARSKRTLH